MLVENMQDCTCGFKTLFEHNSVSADIHICSTKTAPQFGLIFFPFVKLALYIIQDSFYQDISGAKCESLRDNFNLAVVKTCCRYWVIIVHSHIIKQCKTGDLLTCPLYNHTIPCYFCSLLFPFVFLYPLSWTKLCCPFKCSLEMFPLYKRKQCGIPIYRLTL